VGQEEEDVVEMATWTLRWHVDGDICRKTTKVGNLSEVMRLLALPLTTTLFVTHQRLPEESPIYRPTTSV
jgi:hypothetical protein